VNSKEKKSLTSPVNSFYLCLIRSAIKGWLGQQGRGNTKSARRRQRQMSAPKTGTARHQEPRGSPDQTTPKGSARDDRRPQSWRTMKLNSPQGGHAERTPTPRKRNRKGLDSKVSQITVAWRKSGASAIDEWTRIIPARFGPRCVFINGCFLICP